jgi:hypothetical protein
MSIVTGRPIRSSKSRRTTPSSRLAAAVAAVRPSRGIPLFEGLEGRTLFAAPTLTSIATFEAAAGVTGINNGTEDTVYSITYAQLKAMSDAADADGDVIKFRIESVTTGSLKKGTTTVVAGTTLVQAGDTLNWGTR